MLNKTVAFITIHVGFNFGSKLQTIATSEVLKKMGCNPVCINYIPPRVLWKRYWRDAIKSPLRFIKLFVFAAFFSNSNLMDNVSRKLLFISRTAVIVLFRVLRQA